MRLAFQILFILILAYVLELFLPWWSIAIAAFIGGLFLKSKYNFIAGFVAIGLLWLVTALFIDMRAATQLTEKVANIFSLPGKALLFPITALLSGLVGGFASLTGSYLKKVE